MTWILRSILLAALISTFIPAVAVAQQAPVDSLRSRIIVLERVILNLEKRVRELEAARTKSESTPATGVSESGNAQDVQDWRQLRLDMTTDQVRALLGEPDRVEVMGMFTTWRWAGGGNATFASRAGTLMSWSEPYR